MPPLLWAAGLSSVPSASCAPGWHCPPATKMIVVARLPNHGHIANPLILMLHFHRIPFDKSNQVKMGGCEGTLALNHSCLIFGDSGTDLTVIIDPVEPEISHFVGDDILGVEQV